MINPIKINNFTCASPAISKKALEIHYNQHYLKYLEKVNNYILNNKCLKNRDIEEIINIPQLNSDLYNNAAQVYNHEFFFNQFLGIQCSFDKSRFGRWLLDKGYSYLDLKKGIIKEASSLFGSGYIWIYYKDNDLCIEATGNALNLVKRDYCIPLITIDLWEHSYYLDYQSDRERYIKCVLDNVNYSVIDKRLYVN